MEFEEFVGVGAVADVLVCLCLRLLLLVSLPFSIEVAP